MPTNTSKKPNKEPTEVHPSHRFLELSLEQLFNEPVSLKGFDLEENFDEDKQDYSFLLDLALEDLFKIPFSVQEMQDGLDASAAGEKPLTFFKQNGNNHVLLPINISQVLTATEVNSKPGTIVKTTEVPPTTPTHLLPPIIETSPPIFPNEPTLPTVHAFEANLFIQEAESIDGNLFDMVNLSMEAGEIFEVLNVQEGQLGDLDESGNFISVETNFGHLQVNIHTGDFVYDLSDASMVPDVQLNAFDEIPFKIMLSDQSIVEHAFQVQVHLNQAPVAHPDFYETDAHQLLAVENAEQGVLGNDTDPNNSETLTDMKFVIAINGQSDVFDEPIHLPDGGFIEMDWDGTFNFIPGNDFGHLAPGETQDVTFDYTMEDGEGLTSTSTVTIQVTGSIPPPLINIPEEGFEPRAISLLAAKDESPILPQDIFDEQAHVEHVQALQANLPSFEQELSASIHDIL